MAEVEMIRADGHENLSQSPPSSGGPLLSESAAILDKKIAPLRVSFDHLTYTVKIKKGNKALLDDVSASLEPGKLTAIIGASGAGKTTLLNILAGRAKKDGKFKLLGDVTVNGEVLKPEEYQKVSAYLQQDDVMLPNLTAREQLYYTAQLRLPPELSSEQKEARVNELIHELELEHCENTLIGAAGLKRGVSGGERKRVAIACELVLNPLLLLCDEPTTGLDSETASMIVGSLAQLAHRGRTIACTIHQPNSEIFAQFDNLILLSRGKIVYYGPARMATDHFRAIGHDCPRFSNPADFFMRILSEAVVQDELPSPDPKTNTKYLVEQFQSAPLNSTNGGWWKNEPTPPPLPKRVGRTHFRQWMAEIFRQTAILTHRAFRNHIREKRATVGRLASSAMFGLLFGLMFLRLDHDQTGIQSRNGVLFTLGLSAGFTAMNQVVLLFPEERPIFMREYAKGMYSAVSYYIAKNIAEFPLHILMPLPTLAICYYMIGLNPKFERFLIFILVCEILVQIGVSLGMMVGACFKGLQQAQTITPLVTLPLVVMSGLMINLKQIPKYFIWMEKISPFRYGFEALLRNDAIGQRYYCKSDQFTNNGTICRYTNGSQIVQNFFFHIGVWPCVYILLGLFAAFRILGCFTLVLFARLNRAGTAA